MTTSRHLRLLLPAVLVLVAAGCTPKLDSDDLEASIAAMSRSLDEEERGRFGSAAYLVQEASAGRVKGTEAFSVDGMTAEEVFAEAEKIDLRQRKALVEERIAARRALLAEAERMDVMAPEIVHVRVVRSARPRITVKVTNGFDQPVGSGWLRSSVPAPNGRRIESVDFVGFEPPLSPGEERQTEVIVSGDLGRVLGEVSRDSLSVAFTMLEYRGTVIAQEANADETRRALQDLEEAQKELEGIEESLRRVELEG